jgi:purine-binding chemotaxis protein CheW
MLLDIVDNPVGIVVDSVAGVTNVPRNGISLPSELPAYQQSKYVTGVARVENRLVLLVNLSTVLTFSDAFLAEAQRR